MTALHAFHGDPAVKQFYISRVEDHQRLDRIVQGTGYEDGHGCAVGCTLQSYDHSRYPIELGIPEWLARVEDRIHEGVSPARSKTWPHEFLSSIPVGVDLEQVKPKFLVMVLASVLASFDHSRFPDVKGVIDRVITLWRRDDVGSAAWKDDAAVAAWAAAWATEAPEAAAAAVAAWAAAAAEAAAEAAGSRSARVNKYEQFADGLLDILRSLTLASTVEG